MEMMLSAREAEFTGTLARLGRLTHQGKISWQKVAGEVGERSFTPPLYPALVSEAIGLRFHLEDERLRLGPYEPDGAWLREGRWLRYRLVISETGHGVPLVSPPMQAATDLAADVLGETFDVGDARGRIPSPAWFAGIQRQLDEVLER